MTTPTGQVWLVAGYSLMLMVFGWGFDVMARRVSVRAAGWRTGGFTYHPDHDAWRCPQDQWLWPTSFDPQYRVMRYRAKPSVCNCCPVKDECTGSPHGREISRDVDAWPHSEAGRFHRGIACFVAGLGVLMPLATIIGRHSAADVLLLGGVAVVVSLAGVLPLARHLWTTPAWAPAHLPQRSGLEDQAAAAIDRYSTRWGSRGG